jgi:hypothetical protein
LKAIAAARPEVAALAATLASRRRVRIAVGGQWLPLASALREEAATCAAAGVPLQSALDVIVAFVDALTPRAVALFRDDPTRLAATLSALHVFAARAGEAVRDSYASV